MTTDNPDQASLQQLLDQETPATMLQFILTQLASGSFPTTNFGPASSVLKTLQAESISLSDQSNLIGNIAAMGLLGLSTGAWLDLFAGNFFQTTRYPALPAIVQGSATLLSTVSSPKTVPPAGLSIKSSTGNILQSNNTGSIVLSPGTSTQFVFISQNIGLAQNTGLPTALPGNVSLVTTSPGLSVALTDTGAGSEFLQLGQDLETDESLRTRCYLKWATIGLQKTATAYQNLLLNVTPGTVYSGSYVEVPAKLVIVDSNPRGPGTCNLLVFGDTGPLSQNTINYFNEQVIPVSESICTSVTCSNANPYVLDVLGDVYVSTAFSANAQIQVNANLVSVISQIPINGIIYYSNIFDALSSNVAGIRNIENVLIGESGSLMDPGREDITLPNGSAPVLASPLINLVFHSI